ncbi:MAG: cupredoxin domain-containing protein [Sporichthyaceae bacterium]
MPSLRPARLVVPALLFLLAAPVLAACGDAGPATGTTVAVAASEDTCEVATTNLEAGPVTFTVTNKGSKVTEVYVYGEKDGAFDTIVGEVENIGPGTSRDFSVDLSGGTYEIACKPGQTGDGIRTKVTVTGDAAGETGEPAYDREIEMTVAAAGLTGLDGADAKSGETIEFKLQNDTDGTRKLEILDPSGAVVAEAGVDKGAEGEVAVELKAAGTWTVKVEGGAKEIETPLPVS